MSQFWNAVFSSFLELQSWKFYTLSLTLSDFVWIKNYMVIFNNTKDTGCPGKSCKFEPGQYCVWWFYDSSISNLNNLFTSTYFLNIFICMSSIYFVLDMKPIENYYHGGAGDTDSNISPKWPQKLSILCVLWDFGPRRPCRTKTYLNVFKI